MNAAEDPWEGFNGESPEEAAYAEGWAQGRKEVEAERDALQAQLDRVRAARADAPRCDVYANDEPVSCGWKRTVQNIDAILAND